MRRALFSFFLLCVAFLSSAQILAPIKWSFSTKSISDTEAELLFKATVDQNWHLYGMTLPEGGPTPTTFSFSEIKGATLVGELKAEREPKVVFDESFEMELSWYDSDVTFVQKINIEQSDYTIKGEIVFMACSGETCMPPTPEEFTFGAEEAPVAVAEATTTPSTSSSEGDQITRFTSKIWSPVVEQMKSYNGQETTEDGSLFFIFLAGFVGGLFALLTPCVWPMIPMTVSFFLKRTKDRKKAIRDAITYGVSIIVIYVALGLVITGVFGASALNDLATNAIFNIIFFLLLVVFGVSFLGAFEITLPASWTTKLDSKADSTTGLLSIFFMAFTLALVSFSCTGPIIGTLLVQAASLGAAAGPAVGMAGFAVALAIPFTLFAVFPSMLQSMPKSGGWLNTVKVTLGFLELALALKFLSVADLAYGWRILDREAFLTIWIVIFAMLGFYLIGKMKFSHDSDVPHITMPRLFLSIISFAFAIYMVPGLWGAPLKAVSAFAPPLSTQDFNLYENEIHASFKDYEEGMAYAKKVGKPVLLDFSGYGCVNCRKMEATVWTDASVKEIIDNDYVLITLYVDDKTALPEPIIIEEYGKKRTLRTLGDKWSYLQRYKFEANAQPYYILLDTEAEPISAPYYFNESVPAYVTFLNDALVEFSYK